MRIIIINTNRNTIWGDTATTRPVTLAGFDHPVTAADLEGLSIDEAACLAVRWINREIGNPDAIYEHAWPHGDFSAYLVDEDASPPIPLDVYDYAHPTRLVDEQCHHIGYMKQADEVDEESDEY